MQRDRGTIRLAGVIALALIATTSVAATTARTGAAGTRAETGPAERRSYERGAPMPRHPIAPRTRPLRAAGQGPVRLGRRRLLAGRVGQRLGVRLRLRRTARERPRRVRILLRRVRREDPRHPGARLGGEIVATKAVSTRGRGKRLRVRLRGLGPQPGPHRVIAIDARRDRRLGAARIDALPQEHAPRLRAPRRAAAARPTAATTRSRERGAPGRRALALGLVDHDLSFNPGSESSSAIALAPDDPDRAIAAANDFGAAPVAFVSSRGLASGNAPRRTLPERTELPGPGDPVERLSGCCDPAVAADAGRNLWMATATRAPGGRIVLGRVAPGATDFGPVATGLPSESGSDAQGKPAIAVRGGDRLAVAWIETLGGVQNVVASICDLSAGASACDDPDRWSAPVPLTGAGGLYSMPALAFAPDGDLHAAWWNPGAANAVEADVCRAGEDCSSAAAWDEDTVVARLDSADDDGDGDPDPLPLFCPIIAAPGGLVGPSPAIEVDRDGVVHVAYGDLRENADPAGPSRCTASGSDKTFDALIASGAAPGELPAAGPTARLSDDPARALNDHFLAAVSADPGTGDLEASLYSTEGDPGGQRAHRFYVRSADAGASFSSPARFSDAASRFAGPLSDGIDYGDRQGADASAGRFVPAWTDNRPLQSRDPDLYVLSPQVETEITSGPSGTVPDPSAAFGLATAAVRVECGLDGTRPRGCRSPHPVGPLPNGRHSLTARATDAAGNPMDLTPASAAWTVADREPPETTITQAPGRRTKEKRPRFEFSADEEGARFQCSYDGEPFRGCKTPKRRKVTVGRHTFRVRALDLARNADPTPATETFARKRKCPKRKARRGRC